MRRNALAAAIGAALVATHLAIGRGEPGGPWFGFLPSELGLRLAWMAAAAGFLAWWIRPEPEEVSG